jgi:nicotinic acid mononucleotide adenylyltransferase
VIGCYPGAFDPPTIGHLAVVEAALGSCGLDRLDLVLSEDPLGKAGASPLDERMARLQAAVAHLARVSVVRTSARLLADICAGYDVLVVGADKWAQVLDPAWYGSERARDEALGRLPRVVVAPRRGVTVPDGVEVLPVDPAVLAVSSSEVRAGRQAWAAPLAVPPAPRGRSGSPEASPRPRGGS